MFAALPFGGSGGLGAADSPVLLGALCLYGSKDIIIILTRAIIVKSYRWCFDHIRFRGWRQLLSRHLQTQLQHALNVQQ